MAKLPRFVIQGHPQHVIVRGNNREEFSRKMQITLGQATVDMR